MDNIFLMKRLNEAVAALVKLDLAPEKLVPVSTPLVAMAEYIAAVSQAEASWRESHATD